MFCLELIIKCLISGRDVDQFNVFYQQRRFAGAHKLCVTANANSGGESEPEHTEQLGAGTSAWLGRRSSILQQPGRTHLQKRKANFVRIRGKIKR